MATYSDMFAMDDQPRRTALQEAFGPPSIAAPTTSGQVADVMSQAPGFVPSEPAGPAPTLSKTYAGMPGFEASRLNDPNDLAPKYTYGRFAQDWRNDHGGVWDAAGLRAFVAQDPRWELMEKANGGEPLVRVKQSELDKWEGKQGHKSIWQDPFRDYGGENGIQFENVEGSGEGFAPPSGQGGGADISAFLMDPNATRNMAGSSDFFTQILNRLRQSSGLSDPGSDTNAALRAAMQ